MKKCACKGAFLERFIQPVILMYLNRENLHGFAILKKLKECETMDYSAIDPTGLYRMLKKMTAAGLLNSAWNMENTPQPRCVYAITEAGKLCLASWEKTLFEYAQEIAALGKAVSESMNPEGQNG